MRLAALMVISVLLATAQADADTSGRPKAVDHYKLARAYYESDDYDGAEKECRIILRYNARHAAASTLLSEIELIRVILRDFSMRSSWTLEVPDKRK